MSTHRTGMLNHLNNTFGELAEQDISKFPTFLVIVAMRNALMERNFTNDEASQIVSKMKIELPTDLFEDEDDERITYEIVDSMVKMIAGFHLILMTELDSFDLFLNMIDGANLELT